MAKKDYQDIRRPYTCPGCHRPAARIVRMYRDGTESLVEEVPHKGLTKKVCSGVPSLTVSASNSRVSDKTPVPVSKEPCFPSDFGYNY